MLFHLFRFSIFMLVVMASFALAFHSLFSHPSCATGDDLYETFRTLHDSLLRMFEAMLGGEECPFSIKPSMLNTIVSIRVVLFFHPAFYSSSRLLLFRISTVCWEPRVVFKRG